MIKLYKINSELTKQQDGFRRIKLGISLVVLKFIHYFSIFLAGGLGVGGAIVQASHLKAKEAPSKPTLTAIKVLALISFIAIALLWLSGLSLAYLKYGTILLGTFFFIKLFGAGLILIGATLSNLIIIRSGKLGTKPNPVIMKRMVYLSRVGLILAIGAVAIGFGG